MRLVSLISIYFKRINRHLCIRSMCLSVRSLSLGCFLLYLMCVCVCVCVCMSVCLSRQIFENSYWHNTLIETRTTSHWLELLVQHLLSVIVSWILINRLTKLCDFHTAWHILWDNDWLFAQVSWRAVCFLSIQSAYQDQLMQTVACHQKLAL